MAIIKCKMCGGDLGEAVNGIATCKYCGTTQTVPKTSSERKQQLYDRAEHYRSTNEFDRAFSLYEQILIEDDSDAEVYWDMVLCRYGIEYVEDPKTHERIPTVNRMQYKSIFDDENYLMALEKASDEQKQVLSAEAKRIDSIQNGILEIANKEKPYDIFICYKETDDRGNRTLDSVLAQDMYNELTKEGYKVFFSRITLEDKIGTAYEPYIFAALNSAKIMIAAGTSAANYNAVWVKNEWSRYLGLIRAGEKKTLIPAYRDMDPYDLPDEFAHLQGQDMGKLGFMQDLIRGIQKLIPNENAIWEQSNPNLDPEFLKKRIEMFLQDGDYQKAKKYCEKALVFSPKDGDLYALMLCAEVEVHSVNELGESGIAFDSYSSYRNAIKYGAEEDCVILRSALEEATEQHVLNRSIRRRKIICFILVPIIVIVAAYNIISYSTAQKIVSEADGYIISGKVDQAAELIDSHRSNSYVNNSLPGKYVKAYQEFMNGEYETAAALFEGIDGYDAETMRKGSVRARQVSESIERYDDYKQYIFGDLKDTIVEFQRDYPQLAELYIKSNQEEWYEKAKKIEKNLKKDASDRTKVSYEVLSKCYMVMDLMNLCDEKHQDVKEYKMIYQAMENESDRWEACLTDQYDLDITKYIAFAYWREWLLGSWKNHNGFLYLDLEKKEDENYSFWCSYNLPNYDEPDSSFDIDYMGIYYLTLKDGTQKNMYRFDIISKNEIDVYCYRDESTYTLYRQ